ncbi:MAG: betaine/proline/choline family ABC transporter ATP-binding protein [Actinomycetota bacterium]|nr:betaine/proline/choline family ABC transporter ATP-binding protein [Actinomycetota bacterium]
MPDLPANRALPAARRWLVITLEHVSKRFGPGASAVEDLSLEVAEGEIAVLVGPSGCGKTTTMRMINRLIDPTSGRIAVGGRDVMEQDPVTLRRGIGYVIQTVGLMPHRTVAQNIATVPDLIGWDRVRTKERIEELTAMLELDDELLGRFPAELSGGQRQRVGVARALAADPPVMLMDEPFGAVDPIVRSRLQEQFLGIQSRLRKTVVFVTHDVDEAIKMADRIAILNKGAFLEQHGRPEEILRSPANEFVEQFVGPERGLKRLALIRVAEIEVDRGPVASLTATVEDALVEMKRWGDDWVSVLDGRRLLGWVDRKMLPSRGTIAEVTPKPFDAAVTAESSLREALDALVTSKTKVAAVVEDGQRYRGVLTLQRISGEIVS